MPMNTRPSHSILCESRASRIVCDVLTIANPHVTPFAYRVCPLPFCAKALTGHHTVVDGRVTLVGPVITFLCFVVLSPTEENPEKSVPARGHSTGAHDLVGHEYSVVRVVHAGLGGGAGVLAPDHDGLTADHDEVRGDRARAWCGSSLKRPQQGIFRLVS